MIDSELLMYVATVIAALPATAQERSSRLLRYRIDIGSSCGLRPKSRLVLTNRNCYPLAYALAEVSELAAGEATCTILSLHGDTLWFNSCVDHIPQHELECFMIRPEYSLWYGGEPQSERRV